jgi:hypothetical protein
MKMDKKKLTWEEATQFFFDAWLSHYFVLGDGDGI